MKNIVKRLLEKTGVSRTLKHDAYTISYPKKGRAWLQALIGKYLPLKYDLPEDSILSTKRITSESSLPKVTFTHDGSGMSDQAKLEKLSDDKQAYVRKKVVLTGHNIRDTLVSAYFQATTKSKHLRWYDFRIHQNRGILNRTNTFVL
ncbi:MAG: hypothetical protein OEU78_10370 [Gammaproteobacteria bacterium]|nr:hypothetical protein [Gammaproteobacteria bacterium]